MVRPGNRDCLRPSNFQLSTSKFHLLSVHRPSSSPPAAGKLPASGFELPSSSFQLQSSIFELRASIFESRSSIFDPPSSILHSPSILGVSMSVGVNKIKNHKSLNYHVKCGCECGCGCEQLSASSFELISHFPISPFPHIPISAFSFYN